MKYLRVILILIGCFILIGCEEKYSKNFPKNFHIALNNKIEVYSDIKLKDLVSDINADIINKNEDIDTTKVGNFSYELKFKMNKKKYIYNLKYSVVDTQKPLVLSGNIKTVSLNYDKDLCNLIWFADNYDKKANCTIEGNYNLLEENNYPLKFIITDSSGNNTIHNITLNVVKKINTDYTPIPEDESSRIQFSEVVNTYKTENTEIGIDVSKWQKEIDFEKVKKAGATFVIMRIGSQSDIEGEIAIDTYYKQNIVNAKKAGLKVGVYLYTIATSKKESIEQAKWVINTLDKEKLDLPIVFDWESWNYWNLFNLSLYDINHIADTFIDTVNKSGYKGMLYSSKNYLQYIWQNKNNYPVWLAHYTDKTDYEGEYILWQLTNKGRIDGINTDVDINVMYHK